MADVRALRRRRQREGDPRLQYQQVQRFRLRYHDELRGGCHGDPQLEWVPTGRQSPASLLQDQQGTQVESRAGRSVESLTRKRVRQVFVVFFVCFFGSSQSSRTVSGNLCFCICIDVTFLFSQHAQFFSGCMTSLVHIDDISRVWIVIQVFETTETCGVTVVSLNIEKQLFLQQMLLTYITYIIIKALSQIWIM